MFNKVVFVGHLTRDPELRYTANGTPVANFGLAVDRAIKREGQPSADFFRVSVWGKQAEHCANYLAKGRMVALDGRIEINTYTKDGQERTSVDVTANDVRFLSSGGDKNDAPAQSSGGGQTGGQDSYSDLSDDDLPF